MNGNKLKRVVGATLLAFTLLCSTPSLTAQSPEPEKKTSEVQQLKERLQQLEQTVELLKSQLTSMEDSQKKPDAALVIRNFGLGPIATQVGIQVAAVQVLESSLGGLK